MNKKIEIWLIECHIIMNDALRNYEDRAYMSNKLYELKQYRKKLPKNIYMKIKEFADINISPLVYDVDYWSFIEKDESCGSYDSNHHFIIKNGRSLENILFRKHNRIQELSLKLSDFMAYEFGLDYCL